MQHINSQDELLRIAQSRLYPSITNPSYLVLRRRREILTRWIADLPGNKLMVLDVGGRYQPYRPLLRDRTSRYIALDVMRTAAVDAVGKGQQLPFRNDLFDLVLATSVFEYISDPFAAANEIYRVLKPGSHLIMSVASVYPRVGDEEYWRYLPAGIRAVLSPFAKVEVVPETASVGGFCRMTSASLSIMAKYHFVRTIVHRTAVPLLNLAGLALDRRSISTNDQIAGNFSALAQK